MGFNALGTRAEYAYHLIPAFWGRGYATEATHLALSWAFSRGSLSVEAHVERANAASVRLVERLGFRASGPEEQDPVRYVLANVAPA